MTNEEKKAKAQDSFRKAQELIDDLPWMAPETIAGRIMLLAEDIVNLCLPPMEPEDVEQSTTD